MGWIGGVINLLFGLGSSYENQKMQTAWNKSAGANSGQVMALSQKMLDNAAQDWDHFKTTFAPVDEAAATYAGRDPDYARAEGQVSDAVASGMSQGGNAIVRRRINPNSGATSARINDLTVAGGRAGGIGMGQARRGEEDRLFRERASISDASGEILGNSAITTARGFDTLQTTIKHAARVGNAYGRDAADSLYQAGKGAGQLGYGMSWGNKNYSSPDYDNSGQPDYVWGNKQARDEANDQERFMGTNRRYADGGMVRGPGTGRSDSVPATIDGEQPARVSNGEIIIPAQLVRKIGKHRLDELVARFHKPSGPRVIDGTATRVQFANGGYVRGYGMRAPLTGTRVHRQMPVHG